MMGTRPGDIDPGILVYLLRTKKCTLGDLEEMLEHRAGLLGVSDESGDMRVLAENSSGNPLAVLALTQFVRSIAKSIAGMLVSLGGADLLVFTGGVGEHASTLRNRIIAELSPFAAALPTMVIPARENDCIARHAYQYLAN
jgi:acetate kinase